MADQNLSRKNRRHQKQEKSVFTTRLNYADEIGTSADVYQLFTLPPGSVVTYAAIITETAFDSATSAVGDLGFGDDGDALLDGVDLTSAAGTDLASTTVPIIRETGGVVTFTPVYTGATTEGKFMIVIEYIEYNKATGEVTNFVPEA